MPADIRQFEHDATLRSRRLIAKNTCELVLDIGKNFHFTPGQYVWIVIPEMSEHDPRGNRRAFSIASPPDDVGAITIIFRISDSGFHRTLGKLPIGSPLVVHGPYGQFVAPALEPQPIVLVGGGVGVVPFLSIVFDAARRGDHRPITLVYANTTKEAAPYLKELKKAVRACPTISLVEHYGPLSEVAFVKMSFISGIFYVAGKQKFVDAAYAMLKAKGVEDDRFRFEEFYPVHFREKKLVRLDAFVGGEDMLKQVLESTTNHIIFTNVEGTILFANPAAQRITGYTLEEMRGHTPRLWGGLMPRELYRELWRTIKTVRKPFVGKLQNRRKDGTPYIAWSRISPIVDARENLIGFVGTEEDITKQEDVDKAKSEFVSFASHQLRTPLSSVSWYGEMLLSGDAGPLSSEQKKYVDEICNGNHRMMELVDSLLNISHIELGSFSVKPEPTDMTAMLRKVLAEERVRIDAKKLLVQTKFDTHIAPMNADQKLLWMIFENLLSNAVKYTPQGGRVAVSLQAMKKKNAETGLRQDGYVRFSVKDTGIGIPLSQQGKIFSNLFRADNVRTMDVDGTGLGLYMVKSIIDLIGWKISFRSVEQKGTEFFVDMPLSGMAPVSETKKYAS
jgi:PAS domain S-box-containing protein